MLAIAIKFFSGAYHATPWGRHVNEGVPEWPLSPWRLLRALIATWKRSFPDLSEERVRQLVKMLSSSPPSFWLPPATLGHTRHFMPWFKKSMDDKTMVFDTFVVVPREEPVLFMWDVDLKSEDVALLTDLLDRLSYFGRRESWCQAYLSEPKPTNCEVLTNTSSETAKGLEPVRVLCPSPDVSLDELMVETTELRVKHKRLDPPGSVWTTYGLPQHALRPQKAHRSLPAERYVDVMRFALDGTPLPLVTETVYIGELARLSIMAQYGRLYNGNTSPVISGKDTEGRPLKGHQHAYYLPTDEDRDGRVDHLTLYSTSGFSSAEQKAISRLRELNFGDQRGCIRLLFLGSGSLKEPGIRNKAGLTFGQSKVWESVTPLMLTRYPKTYRDGRPKIQCNGFQQDGPEDQIMREWKQHQELNPNLPDLVSIKRVGHLSLSGRRISWLDFRRWRRFGSAPAPASFGGGFRLEFSNTVFGPVSFGYANHYGLGLFRPVSSSS
jgi:CRISPR-associated protein Csb2